MFAIFYLALIFMLLLAISFLGIFYYRNKKNISLYSFFILSFLFIILSLGGYHLCGDAKELKAWYRFGEKQYEFMMAYERLGGINGMIARLKRQLAEDPDNIDALVILGKLYLAKLDYVPAEAAFHHALELKPGDSQIEHWLDISKNPYQYIPLPK